MAGRLVVCPTPIGNLDDITLRTLSSLREADVVACEDTRRTGILLDRYGVSAKLLSYNEQNERSRARSLTERMIAGETVALVSDAGMPLVSDPGYVLVRECIAAGLAVEVLPGPSAVLAAVVAAGLPSDRWRFEGFLPRKANDLDRLLGSVDETLVAFESPRRVAATVARLAALDPDREVAVCRELTKLHEEVIRGTAAEVAERLKATEPRGEIVLVIGGASAEMLSEEYSQRAVTAVKDLVAAGARPRDAAKVVAQLTGLKANHLYEAGATHEGN